MIARVPVKVWDRTDTRLDANDVVFTVGTRDAEVAEDHTSNVEDPTGFLPNPETFPTVGRFAEAILDAVEDAGYSPEDYADAGRNETVLWAVVEDDPEESDGNEWVRFEEVEV